MATTLVPGRTFGFREDRVVFGGQAAYDVRS
jgi:hypothetical protein